MADPRFFTKTPPLSLKEVAELTGSEIANDTNPEIELQDLAPLDTATESDLSFLDNVKYKDQFKITKAGACFVHPEHVEGAPANTTLLVTPQPYKAYALTAQKLYPEPAPSENISDKASVSPDAKIGKGCTIEPFAVIEEGAEIGDGTLIESGAVIARNVQIGTRCRIGSNSTVSHAIIGDYVRLYPGVRVGQDGFGFAIDPKGHVKVPQLGRVRIENHVEIGANTCIDRGAGPDTVIGQGTWIDNLVQIGHNVQIGKGCIIVSQVGISGSTVLEDFVAIGGQGGVAGHLRLGMGARIAAQSGVMKDVPAGEEQMGYPAMPIRQYMKQVAFLKRLIKKG